MTDTRALRDALAAYPTGVALVTVPAGDGPRAMTVNSFASVSLDPPLILWSVAKDSERYQMFLEAEVFAVNVLGADQEALAAACAKDDDLIAAGAEVRAGSAGAPLVAGAIAWFECRREAVHAGGDHDIIVGRVTDFAEPQTGPALTFHRSAFGRSN